ncbi:DUF937 domain-containing protein [Mesorhizobium sp. ANAO-SY3R2]|uniref:DUF937 domain-containing protein n=1 Tax=Mesorhizobium sp. ANAO-SY3R2 TaxID=3166644 RepID=UPI003671926F
MPTNLISLAMQYLTPDLISRIASGFGIDRGVAEKFAAAAVPALLGGFAKVAATPEGARKLYDTVTKQPPGMLDSIAGAIGGSSQKTLEENGLNIVSSLFGGSMTQTLASTISRFAGVSPGASSSMLGLLAPLVTGMLAKQATAGNLDATGLSQLLGSQKANIQAALPSGFGELLRGSGLLGDIAGQPAKAATAATASMPPMQTSRGTTATSSQMNWAYWAIPLAVVLAAGWWMLGHRTRPPTTEQARTESQDVAPDTTASIPADNLTARAAQALTALRAVPGGTEVANETASAMDTLSASLKGITDQATAQTALPKIQDALTKFDKVNGMAAQLPTGGRSALATLVTASMPTINKQLDKVLAIPGVAPILQKPIDALRSDFESMAKAPA